MVSVPMAIQWLKSGPTAKAMGVSATALADWRANPPSWWPKGGAKKDGAHWVYNIAKLRSAYPGSASNNRPAVERLTGSARARRDEADANIKEIQALQRQLDFAESARLMVPRQTAEVGLAEVASFIRTMFREMRTIVHQIPCAHEDQRKTDHEIQTWIDELARKYQNDLAGRIQHVTESLGTVPDLYSLLVSYQQLQMEAAGSDR